MWNAPDGIEKKPLKEPIKRDPTVGWKKKNEEKFYGKIYRITYELIYKGNDWLEQVKESIKKIKLIEGMEFSYILEPSIVDGGKIMLVELKLKKKKAVYKLTAFDLWNDNKFIAECTYIASGKREKKITVKEIIKEIKLSGNRYIYKIEIEKKEVIPGINLKPEWLMNPLEKIKEFKNERYIMLACIAKLVQTGCRNLTKYIKIDLKEDDERIAKHIVNSIMAGESDYNEDTVETYYIQFYYINGLEEAPIKSKGGPTNINTPKDEGLSPNKVRKNTEVNLKNIIYNLPLNTEYKNWLYTEKTDKGWIMVKKEFTINIEEMKREEGKKLKGLITIEKDNKTYLTIKDYQPKEKTNTLIRNCGNKTIFINKGVIIREEIKRKNTCIKKKKKDKERFDINKIWIMDIETYENKNYTLVPYAIGFKGNVLKIFYIEKCMDALIEESLKWLLENVQTKDVIYSHNGSNFDWILIIKVLIKIVGEKNIKIIGAPNEMQQITVKYKKKRIKLLDSYKILNRSLKDLCEIYNTKIKKGTFDYSFINEETVHFIGKKPENPEIVYNVKEETIMYLTKDLESLYEIIKMEGEKIQKIYKLNQTKYPTAASTSMAILRSNFFYKARGVLFKKKVVDCHWNKCKGALANKIKSTKRQALYALKSFKRAYKKICRTKGIKSKKKHMKGFWKKYKYMAKDKVKRRTLSGRSPKIQAEACLLKVQNKKINSKQEKKHYKEGIVHLSEKDSEFIRESFRGGRSEVFRTRAHKGKSFDINSFYPSILRTAMPTGSPTYFKGYINIEDERYYMYVRANVSIPQMDIGVLPIKHNNSIIYPIGEINGVFTNVELINAKKNGCTIEIIEGLFFRKKIMFHKFITQMYNLRKQWPITKLWKNSLYGKLAKKPYKIKTKIIDKNELEHYTKKTKITNILEVDENYIILSYYTTADKGAYSNVNIAIGAMVTSIGRVYMYNMVKKYNAIAVTTDAIFVEDNQDIDVNISGLIGEWKIEIKFEEACFVASNLYALKTIEGEEIIKASGINQKNTKLTWEQLLYLLNKDNDGITIQQERIYKHGLELKKKHTDYKLKTTTEKIPVYANKGDIGLANKEETEESTKYIIKYVPPHIKMEKIPKLQIQTLETSIKADDAEIVFNKDDELKLGLNLLWEEYNPKETTEEEALQAKKTTKEEEILDEKKPTREDFQWTEEELEKIRQDMEE